MNVSTVAGVLRSPEALQEVVDHLETAGFDRSQFGVLASKAALDAGLGEASADALLENPATPTRALEEPESGGALRGALVGGLAYLGVTAAAGLVVLTGGGLGLVLAAIAGAGAAGGLVGALVAHGFDSEHARVIETQLEHGGMVLWVSPRDEAQRRAAVAELQRSGSAHILVHPETRH
jgi:outer membrane lipoprotein SlyB